ncbi:hypothetical protein CR513_16554, partial [Mucuna pruriens]
MARGEKISKLYWTKALVAKDNTSLWHRRLSHISERGLNCLAKKGMLLGLKNAKFEKCSHCMDGKQTRVSFKKHSPSRKSEFLELVHSDVCGPLKVYTLKLKDQVLEKFKHFQALFERQSGKKVKCIHSYNGGEYYGPFDVYCKQQCIKHEKNPPKTPQLNGFAEKMNKTLIERVRCMLFETRLPKHFWGKALCIAVHIINFSPTVALDTEVTNNIWFGKDCIFIGYGQDEYGYRLYDPILKKLVRSCDVQFMEDRTIEDIDKVNKTTPKKDNNLSEIDMDTADNNVQNGEQHNYVGDQQLGDGFNVPPDAKEEQKMLQDENPGDVPEPPPVQFRRSNRQRQSSTRYTSCEYVTLTNGEELECYQKSMESEERQNA